MANGSFNGRLALITGGSTGIGLALAKLLVKEGAQVCCGAPARGVGAGTEDPASHHTGSPSRSIAGRCHGLETGTGCGPRS